MSENEKAEGVLHEPVIIIPGIGQSKVEQFDSNGNKVGVAWPLDLDAEKLLGGLKGPFLKMVMFKKDKDFLEKMSAVIAEATDPIAVKPDGSMKHDLRPVRYPSLADCDADQKRYIYKMVPMQELGERIGEENLYFFSYNSFGRPYDTAKELDEFITGVLNERGAQKVSLVSVSLGGAILTAYLDEYGSKGVISRVVNMVAAMRGTHLVADLLDGNIQIDKATTVLDVVAGPGKAAQLEQITKILPQEIFNNIAVKAVDCLRDDVAGNSAAIWATVPPDRYETVSAKLLSDEAHAALRETTNRYFAAQKRVADLYQEQKDRFGVKFYFILGCGLHFIPIAASQNMSSDTVINVSSASLGALAAPLDGELPAADSVRYCTDEAHEHISPDGMIDASYGFAPDSTWFIKGQSHDAIADNKQALLIAAKALSEESFTSVFDDPALPQFMDAPVKDAPADGTADK